MSEMFESRMNKNLQLTGQQINCAEIGAYANKQEEQFFYDQEKKNYSSVQKGSKAARIERDCEKLWKSSFTMLNDVVARRQVLCDTEDLSDLTAFLGDSALESMDLLAMFLGVDERLAEMDKNAAMEHMLKKILSTKTEDILSYDDKDIVQNAPDLERLTWRMAAFDRLSQRYKYFENMEVNEKKQINDELSKVRSVANYYLLRKETITEPGQSGQGMGEIPEKMLGNRQLLQNGFDRSGIMKLSEEATTIKKSFNIAEERQIRLADE